MAEARFLNRFIANSYPLAGLPGEMSLEDAHEDALNKTRKMLEKSVDPAKKYSRDTTPEMRDELENSVFQHHQEIQDFIEANAGTGIFFDEVRLLQGQIDELLTVKNTIKDPRVHCDHVKLFLRLVEVFYTDYSFVMRLNPDPEACGIKLKHLNEIRRFQWKLRKLYSHWDFTPLSDEIDGQFAKIDEVHTTSTRNSRLRIALWALHPLIIAVSGLRHVLEIELWNTLNDDLKWLVDWSIVLPAELQVLIDHIGSLLTTMDKLLKSGRNMILLAKDPRNFRMYDLVDPHVGQAVDSASVGDTCGICRTEYAQRSSATENDEESHELAVRIEGCNHTVGMRCLQEWISQQGFDCTCPMCRAPFFDLDNPVFVKVAEVTFQGLEYIRQETGSVAQFQSAMPEIVELFSGGPRAHLNDPKLMETLVRQIEFRTELQKLGDKFDEVTATVLTLPSTGGGNQVPPEVD